MEETQQTPQTEPAQAQPQAQTAAPSDYEDRMLEAFVQKPEKFQWYKNAFAKFNVNGVDKPAWVWSWWAFFGTFWFLLYRKAYLPALGFFIANVVASFVPILGLVVWILTGGYATYFVYKTYKAKKEEIEAKIADPEKRIETMRAVGGYNQWVVWLAVILSLLWFAGIVAAIAIPQMVEPTQTFNP
jgi:hypothetical protein